MGNGAIHNNFSYSLKHSDPQKEGESNIFRHPKCQEFLLQFPNPNIKTIQDLLISLKKYDSKPCFGTQIDGIYHWKTYQNSMKLAKDFGSGLIELNIVPPVVKYKDWELNFLAIYSKNREEVVIAESACALYGWTSLPIYDTLGPEAIDFILEQTEVELIVCSLENLGKLVKGKHFGKMKNIITLEPITDPLQKQQLSEFNLSFTSYEDVVKAGEKKENPFSEKITPSSIFTFSYTSGTTGKPKGAMLSHGNIISVVANSLDALEITQNDVYISYLPLAHVLEKVIIYTMLFYGCSIGFYKGDVQKLKDDLAILKPTLFVTVPRLLLRFYDVIKGKLDNLKGCKKSLADRGIKKKLMKLNRQGSVTYGFYDKLIFKKMRSALGGRIRRIIVGSAPTSPDVLNFLKIAFSCNIMEGYGQTESTGASFTTNWHDNRASGTVGGPCCNTEFKLVDVPEMNYKSTDKDEYGNLIPRGEMCIRGHGVFQGYYKDEEKTKEAIDDLGWLHTGDIVQINANGSIKIIDRKKNIFKLSQGEYVAAEKIESVYLLNKYISEIFIYGDSFQSYLIAILVPDLVTLKELVTKNGLIKDKSFEEILNSKEVKNLVLSEMNKTAKENKLLSFEMAKNIFIEKESFALKELLTTTFKLKRHEAKKYYEKTIVQLYEENLAN